MTDIICPLCGKTNPPDRDECQYCQAPLKTSGFIPSSDQDEISQLFPPSSKPGEEENLTSQTEATSPLEDAIPDWLKQTEANFLEKSEAELEVPTPDNISEQIDSLLNQPFTPASDEKPAIDDEWLASLLAEAGATEPAPVASQEEISDEGAGAAETDITESHIEEPDEEEQQLPAELPQKPDWLTNLEAASPIKLEGGIPPAREPVERAIGVEAAGEEEEGPSQDIPDWISKPGLEVSTPSAKESEQPIAPAELPGWLEAFRPDEEVSPTRPVEDLSAADIVTAGPLVGLRGVISPRSSAIRASKPPTYSIKLRVTDEQQARVEMMKAMLADEDKPRPLPSQPAITSWTIFRLVIAVVLILPIFWMIISRSQQAPAPQPGDFPGMVDFTQQVQLLPNGAPVLLAFDYEVGFSGEMNLAISTVIDQLISKSAYLTLVSTTPSGPALAESLLKNIGSSEEGNPAPYSYYTDLGYIPGGTMGLLGLATSPRSVLPYSLDGNNVWTFAPLNTISSIKDFSAVFVMTNDPDTARAWIEQTGPSLQAEGTPLLIVSSAQAEPLIRPYYEATPKQVQGLVAGLAGGLAYGRTVGSTQQNGVWDALSIGVTISVLIILIGSIASVILIMLASEKKKGS